MNVRRTICCEPQLLWVRMEFEWTLQSGTNGSSIPFRNSAPRSRQRGDATSFPIFTTNLLTNRKSSQKSDFLCFVSFDWMDDVRDGICFAENRVNALTFDYLRCTWRPPAQLMIVRPSVYLQLQQINSAAFPLICCHRGSLFKSRKYKRVLFLNPTGNLSK